MDAEQTKLFREVDDYRAYWDEIPDVRQWRIYLREKLFHLRLGRSDLTQKSLLGGFDLHEGIFSRRWVSKANWQAILFSGINCFLLPDDEHRIMAPDRTICYWLAVARYGIIKVDAWIDSLQFNAPPSKPWRGTNGLDILATIPYKWRTGADWGIWLSNVTKKVDFIHD